jgi:hypothetical protein
MKEVFLSSTSELEEYRDAVRTAIVGLDGYRLVAMEYFGARDHKPIEYCQKTVARSDIFIGLIGARHGSCPKGSERSFTELEYKAAREAGKRLLIFITPDDFPCPANLSETDEKRLLQQAFRARVTNEYICDTFTTPDNLALRVVQAIRHIEREEETPSLKKLTPEVEVPPKPRESSIPSYWWAITKGRFDYWRARKTRARLIDYHTSYGIDQPLPSVLQSDITIPYYKWPSRPEAVRSKNIGALIGGLPGAGKTRFLNELFIGEVSNTEIVFKLSAARLETALRNEDLDIIWNQIAEYFWFTTPAGNVQLTRPAISFALSHRKILVVIEDVQTAGSPYSVVKLLKKYFESHHRWAEHITILMTYRGSIDSKTLEQLSLNFEFFHLEPLDFNTHEPQDFFLKLCKTNDISVDVSAIGEELANAFSTETTRTPLFIVICAWLAAKSSDKKDTIGRMLRMQSSEVFDAFIDELHRRAQERELNETRQLAIFRKSYELLAFQLWPRWRDFIEDQINSCLQFVNNKSESAVTLKFLVDNGFLFRSEEQFGNPSYSFPHQSMVDFMVAKRMIALSQFTKLTERKDDGVIASLGELIDDIRTLLKLAQDDFMVFIQVLTRNQTILRGQKSGRLQEFYSKTAKIAAGWAGNHAKWAVSENTWICVREILAERWVRWRDVLCENISASEASSRGVEALCVIGGECCMNLLSFWLKDDKSRIVFSEARPWESVVDFLLAFFEKEGLGVAAGREALRLAWLNSQVRTILVLRKWLSANILTLKDPALKLLIDLGENAIGALAEECHKTNLVFRKRISSVIAGRGGRILLPKGQYSIFNGEKDVIVKLKRSLLIDCKSSPIIGEFSVVGEALREAKRFINNPSDLLDWDEIRCIHKHFRHDDAGLGRQKGVLFGSGAEAYYEVFYNPQSRLMLDLFYEGIDSASGNQMPYRYDGASIGSEMDNREGVLIKGLHYRNVTQL